jgi:hypothetical protein
MDKIEFFRRAIRDEAYVNTYFIISLFSNYKPKNPKETPYAVITDGNRQYFFDPESGEEITLRTMDGVPEPLFKPLDRILVTPDDLINVKENIETTIGNVIFNAYVLIKSVGDKIPFLTGRENGKRLMDAIEVRLVSNGKATKPDDIEVHEYEKLGTYLQGLEALSQVCVPSGSYESFTAHPDRFKFRQELLEKYKDQLDDPLVIARMAKEFEKMDREYVENSISKGFYIKDKSFKVVRQRLHYMSGAEATKDSSKLELIEKSLSEGIEVKHLPKMLSTQRRGSYLRGMETALGGEMVKYFLRVFQNDRVVEGDCETKHSFMFTVEKWNTGDIVNLYYMDNNKPVLITKDGVNTLIGKTIPLRLGAFCAYEGNTVCEICMGTKNAANPNSIAELASNVPTASMLASMSAMHGNALSVVDYNLLDRLN